MKYRHYLNQPGGPYGGPESEIANMNKTVHLTYAAIIVAAATAVVHFKHEGEVVHQRALTAAYGDGYNEARKDGYKDAVVTCQRIPKSLMTEKLCLMLMTSGSGDDDRVKLLTEGFRGPMLNEIAFKTKAEALSHMNEKGWDLADAHIDGETVIWEQYPRTFKVTPTKKGWSIATTLANIDPELNQ